MDAMQRDAMRLAPSPHYPPTRPPQRIAPVRADGNLLLCSLLFGNVAVNVLISILMADLTSGLVGFFASTILIVIVGDVLPQVRGCVVKRGRDERGGSRPD